MGRQCPARHFTTCKNTIDNLIDKASLPFSHLCHEQASECGIVFTERTLHNRPVTTSSELQIIGRFHNLPLIIQITFSFPDILFFIITEEFIPTGPVRIIRIRHPLLLHYQRGFDFLKIGLFLQQVAFFIRVQVCDCPKQQAHDCDESLCSHRYYFSISQK